MTFQAMYEEVRQIFSKVGLTQIKADLNKSYKRLCTISEVLKTSANLTIVDDTIEYSLPSDCQKLTDVRFYDSDGKPLTGYRALMFELRPDNKLIFYEYEGSTITEIPSRVSTIKLFYVKIPTALSADSDTPDFVEDFHECIVWDVLSQYYSKFPIREVRTDDGRTYMDKDLSSAKWFRSEFIRMERELRKYANANKDGVTTMLRTEGY